jgi:hypothetical protein
MKQPIVKKEWNTPELIIMVRSKPEDPVLQYYCKTAGTNDAPRRGPSSTFSGCWFTPPGTECGSACEYFDYS